MSKIKTAAAGILIGFVNGLFGAGGGMIAVPVLKRMGYSQNDAQANAISVILPLSLVSFVIYLIRGYVRLLPSLIYIPAGLAGAAAGTWLMSKIKPKPLRWIFSALMVWAGIRMMMK